MAAVVSWAVEAAARRARAAERAARQAETLSGLARSDFEHGDTLRQVLERARTTYLRTPLAGIKASVSTLRQTDVDWSDAEREELLAGIEESADRLDAIVENLLDASRLEAGALTVQPVSVALDEVIAAALLSVPGASEAVTIDVPEDLPLVRADPGLLERVVANLLENAVRHGGGGPVQVTATAGEESARIKVVDHGPGVPEAERERLFQPFQRAAGRSTVGAGLGLTVARGFTEAMDGALIADGSDGGGLTMRLRLPLAR